MMKIISITLGSAIRCGAVVTSSFASTKHDIEIDGNFVLIKEKDSKRQFATTIFNLKDIEFEPITGTATESKPSASGEAKKGKSKE